LFVGYGIFATQQFEHGDFILDYHGQLMDPTEADKLDQEYIYYFTLGHKQYR